jgi:hypothetical protein
MGAARGTGTTSQSHAPRAVPPVARGRSGTAGGLWVAGRGGPRRRRCGTRPGRCPCPRRRRCDVELAGWALLLRPAARSFPSSVMLCLNAWPLLSGVLEFSVAYIRIRCCSCPSRNVLQTTCVIESLRTYARVFV